MAVTIVTGCSSGLGAAAAMAFARRGDRVYATVRRAGSADDLLAQAEREGLDLRPRLLDLTRPQTFPALIDDIVSESDRIDVLVNNAGVLRPGALEDLRETALREVMETNFFGPILLTRALLPTLRAQRGGIVIMISSLSGLAGLAGDVAYSASKFALEGATEALRHEVDRWGIRLALVEPGQYATRLFRTGGALPADYPTDSPYRALVEQRLGEVEAGSDNALNPDDLAELLPVIADSSGEQLRWPADAVAEHVLASMHAKNDAERDQFLRAAGGSDWWSSGRDHAPGTGGETDE